MANNYDAVDLHWSWNGDFAIAGGDLKDTSSDALRSLIQDIHTVCASSVRDWENYPGLGATLDDFLGEPNNATIAAQVTDRLKVSLAAAGVASVNDIAIRIVPIHINKVLIIIGIDAVATAFNNLDPDDRLIVTFVFDSVEQQIHFLDQTPQLLPES